MSIKFKITTLTWKWAKSQPDFTSSSCANYCQYLIDNHGFKDMLLAGGIGHTGEKVHALRVIGKYVSDNTIEVADVMSICGSDKWRSGLYLHGENLDICDCQRCQPKIPIHQKILEKLHKEGENE